MISDLPGLHTFASKMGIVTLVVLGFFKAYMCTTQHIVLTGGTIPKALFCPVLMQTSFIHLQRSETRRASPRLPQGKARKCCVVALVLLDCACDMILGEGTKVTSCRQCIGQGGGGLQLVVHLLLHMSDQTDGGNVK